jgi:alpha-beta hydrolase superfamily lysophospholipase
MKHIEGTFKGQKGINLYYQGWVPETEVRSVIILAHGVAEHSGRYSAMAEHFASRGSAVYGFDYRGHGKSEGGRCCVEHFLLLSDDLHIFLDRVGRLHPDKKIFLFGHSMGSAVIMAATIKYSENVEGLILSGIPLRFQPRIPYALITMLHPVSVLAPNLGLYRLNSDTLSRDQEVVRAYNRDPLVFRGKLTARLTIEFIRTLHRLETQISRIKIPTLIVHGSADRLCAPEGAQIAYERIGSSDKTLKYYRCSYHEVFNEPERRQILSDIESWIRRHRDA